MKKSSGGKLTRNRQWQTDNEKDASPFDVCIMWHWLDCWIYLALLSEVSDSPSLCNNWLRLRRLHRRPALAVRVEVICNKKQSGNIPPLPSPSRPRRLKLLGWVQLGLDTPDTETGHTPHITHCRPGGQALGPHTQSAEPARNNVSVSVITIDLCFCDWESVLSDSLNLRQNWCHQTDVLIFPGVWPTDTN